MHLAGVSHNNMGQLWRNINVRPEEDDSNDGNDCTVGGREYHVPGRTWRPVICNLEYACINGIDNPHGTYFHPRQDWVLFLHNLCRCHDIGIVRIDNLSDTIACCLERRYQQSARFRARLLRDLTGDRASKFSKAFRQRYERAIAVDFEGLVHSFSRAWKKLESHAPRRHAWRHHRR